MVDLDSKRGDVAGDADRLYDRLSACGAAVVRDVSPSGGQHLYVLLADPVSIVEMSPVARGLEAAAGSVDVAPLVNVAGGYIRPPGSRHRSGGWQQLLQPLPQVIAALSRPASRQVWDQIRAEFPPPARPASPPAAEEPLEPAYQGQVTGRYAQIATTGDWSGYPSPSEARQAVVWAAVASGLTLTTVVARIETGAWPGLRSLYSRYGRHQHAALSRDWHTATRFERQRRGGTRSTVHPCNTREINHSPSLSSQGKHASPEKNGAWSISVRDWLNAIRLLRHRWQTDPTTLLVLRALAQAAQQTGSTIIERGVRSLALATHVDPATISRVLARLLTEPEPVLIRDARGRGTRADQYRLVVPASIESSLTQMPWRPGQTRALHPVARGLGQIAGWVWEELRAAATPVSVRDLTDQIPYSRQAIHQALRTLASYDLAYRTPSGWTRGTTNPDHVAIAIGADITHHTIVRRYQDQRRAWIDYLINRGRHILLPPALAPPTTPPPPPPSLPAAAPPPSDDIDTPRTVIVDGVPMDYAEYLLITMLGAIPIDDD